MFQYHNFFIICPQNSYTTICEISMQAFGDSEDWKMYKP